MDLREVWKSEGVITVVTNGDIPGRNDVGPVFNGDPIFPTKKVEFYGQPLFAVAARSTDLARKAVLKAQKSLEKDFQPIDDMRASKNYRMEIAKNLLLKCFTEIKKNKLIRLNY